MPIKSPPPPPSGPTQPDTPVMDRVVSAIRRENRTMTHDERIEIGREIKDLERHGWEMIALKKEYQADLRSYFLNAERELQKELAELAFAAALKKQIEDAELRHELRLDKRRREAARQRAVAFANALRRRRERDERIARLMRRGGIISWLLILLP